MAFNNKNKNNNSNNSNNNNNNNSSLSLERPDGLHPNGRHSSDRDAPPFTEGGKASQHTGHFPIPAFPPYAARTLHSHGVPATEETTRT